MQVAEYGSRIITFKDGQIVVRRAERHGSGSRWASWRCVPAEDAGDDDRFQTCTIALRALARNKLQTALTIVGMTIGVATVLTMIALGTGAEARHSEHRSAPPA